MMDLTPETRINDSKTQIYRLYLKMTDCSVCVHHTTQNPSLELEPEHCHSHSLT